MHLMSEFYTVNEVSQKSYFLKKGLVMNMIGIFLEIKRFYFDKKLKWEETRQKH